MAEILKAEKSDISGIEHITKLAFEMYRDELHSDAPVKALSETPEDILCDIENHQVFVAKSQGKLLGCIRIKKLTDKVAYIYRFSVHPGEHNAGIGSELLEAALNYCVSIGIAVVTLHTNAKYFKLARYYYGKQFYVHSTTTHLGYIRALFVKNLNGEATDLSEALKM